MPDALQRRQIAHPATVDAGVGSYRELFDASVTDPEAFWAEAARDVSWIREPAAVLDDTNPPFYRWFPDAELNTCANALDRHVANGRGDQPALIYDSPVTGTQRTLHLRRIARRDGAIRRCAARVWAWARATVSWCTCR